jgi:hypothetical protein
MAMFGAKDKDDDEKKVKDELKKEAEKVNPKPALGKILNRAKSGEAKDRGKKGDKK